MMYIHHSISFLFHTLNTYSKSGKWRGKQMMTVWPLSLAFCPPLNRLQCILFKKKSFLPMESKWELNKTPISITTPLLPGSHLQATLFPLPGISSFLWFTLLTSPVSAINTCRKPSLILCQQSSSLIFPRCCQSVLRISTPPHPFTMTWFWGDVLH